MELVEYGEARMDENEVGFIKAQVELIFGAAHENVEIDGVYFYDEKAPSCVYLTPDNRFLVAVCLPVHQADDPLARLVHLSHELVHCLNPNGLPSRQATVLEEGLGEHAKVYLGRQFYQDQFPDYEFENLCSGKYLDAFLAVEEAVKAEGLERFRSAVRKLRKDTGLPFCKITSDILTHYLPQTCPNLISTLSENFAAWPGRATDVE